MVDGMIRRERVTIRNETALRVLIVADQAAFISTGK
jgi:hypothetical protein